MITKSLKEELVTDCIIFVTNTIHKIDLATRDINMETEVLSKERILKIIDLVQKEMIQSKLSPQQMNAVIDSLEKVRGQVNPVVK